MRWKINLTNVRESLFFCASNRYYARFFLVIILTVGLFNCSLLDTFCQKLLASNMRDKPFVPEEEGKKEEEKLARARDSRIEQKGDADDDELRADMRPGWCERCITIREINVEIWAWMNDTRRAGGTNGDQTRKRAVVKKRIARGGQGRRGDEIVTRSINESSEEIVRGREYRRSKLDRELKGWVMKAGRLDEWLESKCERVRRAFVPHNRSRIKLYLSSADHSGTATRLKVHRSFSVRVYEIVGASLKFKRWLWNFRAQHSRGMYPRSKPRLSDKTDSSRVDEFSPRDKILINMRQNGSTTTKRGNRGREFKDAGCAEWPREKERGDMQDMIVRYV